MATVKVLESKFIYSVPKLSLMKELHPEVAFVGRSNVGKSTLINALCNQKNLARSSKTPGRTRHAVVYEMLMSKASREKTISLVDLPGFGFASMSKVEAAECEKLIRSYIEEREPLRQLFVLLDIRREPDEREAQIIRLAQARNIDLLVVLTKSDKISLSARIPTRKRLAAAFGLALESVLLHSTSEHKMTEELLNRLYISSP
jgi:GTP-binding protein